MAVFEFVEQDGMLGEEAVLAGVGATKSPKSEIPWEGDFQTNC